ncbi:hypothetical protein ABZS94_34520 [Streptomyces sp. NPDC005500]|uniref:hypothetical protein n=1 Tax=Streptomyces sp. NPDC005500 TaxID=3155007 RepID=UPI0033BBBA6A
MPTSPTGWSYYVAGRKPEILVASGKAPLESFVPQTDQPGREAEVDFGLVATRPNVFSSSADATSSPHPNKDSVHDP